MRELSLNEIQAVSGAGVIADSTTVGTGAGAAFGVIATNTIRGGAMGGALGAAVGFAAGTGWVIGTAIYDGYTKLL